MPKKGAALCHGSIPFSPVNSLHHQKESPLVYQDIQVTAPVERGKFLPYFKEELSPSGKCENEYIENHRINHGHELIDNLKWFMLSSLISFPVSWGWKAQSLHNHTSDTHPPASVALYSNIKLVPQPVPNSTSSYSHKDQDINFRQHLFCQPRLAHPLTSWGGLRILQG